SHSLGRGAIPFSWIIDAQNPLPRFSWISVRNYADQGFGPVIAVRSLRQRRDPCGGGQRILCGPTGSDGARGSAPHVSVRKRRRPGYGLTWYFLPPGECKRFRTIDATRFR